MNRTLSGPPCPPSVGNVPLQRFGVENSCSHHWMFGPRNAGTPRPETKMELKGIAFELQLYAIQIPSFGPNVAVGSVFVPVP